MAKYICKLRRGDKDSAGRDDWAEYEAKPDHVKPLYGELVIEYDNGIPRLKIGDGEHEFSQLPYISVDSFLLPKTASVYLDPNAWESIRDESNEIVPDAYYQEVVVDNATITANSKVDLQPDALQLLQLSDAGISLVAENDSGVVIVRAVGGVPATDCGRIQVTVKEIVAI